MTPTELQTAHTIITELLAAYGPIAPRKATVEQFVDRLKGFTLPEIREACNDWLDGHRERPTIADIRQRVGGTQATRQRNEEPHDRWPSWVADIWGPEPEGPKKRQAAMEADGLLVASGYIPSPEAMRLPLMRRTKDGRIVRA
jgi:hypothetical protein